MNAADSAPPRTPVHPVLWIMIAIMIGFELMFAAVEAGLLPAALGRWPVYQQLAFFDFRFTQHGLLRVQWVSQNEAALVPVGPQTVWSLLTHAFLHGGWLHLAMNGAAFLGLGKVLVEAVGAVRFLVIFAVCAVAGALTFGLISDSLYPMVGASGAIFGMLAVITAWQERALRLMGRDRSMIWRRIGGLVVLNLVLALGLGGLLAWQAHLGGWIAGCLLAAAIRPRRPRLGMF